MGVGRKTFQSAGQISQHSIPGAYSRIDSVKGSSGFASVTNAVIMGQCIGGVPKTLLQFNNLKDAVATLKGGPLMEAVRMAFNPGNEFVPQRLYAMRVNPATQSSVYLVNGTSQNMIKLLSRDYGLQMNQIKAAMATGTTEGKKLTFTFKTDVETLDNIIRNSFTITYSNGACTMTINNNSGAHNLSTSVGGINITDLNAYPTIGDLCSYISSIQYFTATPIAGQESKSTLELDAVTAQSIATAYTAQSTFQAIVDKVNSSSIFVQAEAVNAANNRVIPANLTAIYMSGAVEGTYDASAWSTALGILEAEDVNFVATPDTSTSVHAVIKTHCETMCAVTGKRERQYLVGGAWGDAYSTAITNAKTNNSKPGLYVFNGFTQYDVNGVLQNYSASYAACLLAGMAAASAINEPLTFKTLNVVSLEAKLGDSVLEQCIENGVCPLAYNTQKLPHIVRQVTTYQTDDLKWNEFSMVKEMYFVSRDLRTYVQNMYTGRPGTVLSGGAVRGAVQNRLTEYEDLGVFMAGSDGNAWWNVLITLSGDVVTVDYDANVTAPINFLFITSHMHEVIATL
jgi:hypothetical protein